MNEFEKINAKLDMVLAMMTKLIAAQPPEKPMTIAAFGKRVGLSRWTIRKRIKDGFIITKGGKVPPSELKKFGCA